MPHLYDVVCICQLADLAIKTGLETLPVNIDQLFVDVFIIVAREVSSLLIIGVPFLMMSQILFSNIAPHDG